MTRKAKKGLRLRAKWRAMNGYFRFGFLMSGFVLTLFAVLALGSVKTTGQVAVPRWKVFFNASPNEIGDTIAGLAGTLAFLWIIVTVMIQGSELRLQRRELAMTRRELKAQREASEDIARWQKILATATSSRADLYRDELEMMSIDVKRNEVKELFNSILFNLSKLQSSNVSWHFPEWKPSLDDPVALRIKKTKGRYFFPFARVDIQQEHEALFEELNDSLWYSLLEIRSLITQGYQVISPEKSVAFERAFSSASKIRNISLGLHPADREALSRKGIFRLYDLLEQMDEDERMWANLKNGNPT